MCPFLEDTSKVTGVYDVIFNKTKCHNLHKTVLIMFNCSATCYDHTRLLSRSFMCQQVALTKLTLDDIQSQEENVYII